MFLSPWLQDIRGCNVLITLVTGYPAGDVMFLSPWLQDI